MWKSKLNCLHLLKTDMNKSGILIWNLVPQLHSGNTNSTFSCKSGYTFFHLAHLLISYKLQITASPSFITISIQLGRQSVSSLTWNHQFTFLSYYGLIRGLLEKYPTFFFLCEHLMDYNLARLHEPTLNLSAHA